MPSQRALRLTLAAVAPVAAATLVAAAAAAPRLTLGGAVVGDVTASQAVLWARASEPTVLHVQLAGGPHARIERVLATAARDLTAGQFTAGDTVLGLKEGGVALAPVRVEFAGKADALAKVDALRARIVAGEVVVPAR